MSLLSRRRFISQAAVASVCGVSAASTFLGCAGKSESAATVATRTMPIHSLDHISVQLYTLRSLMKESVPDVLSSVRQIGFDQVEFAGYFDHSPADIRKMLDDNGLRSPSSHVSLEQMLADPEGQIETAKVIGQEYVIVPFIAQSLRSTIDGYKTVSGQLNELGAKCQSAGIKLGYHNHAFEFETLEGQVPYDVMMAECDPELVAMQLDIFWIVESGANPIDYFNRYPGRFQLCHVKDRAGDGTMVDVGNGVIDFGSLFAMSETAGLQYYVVEHDNPGDPMESVRASFNHLKALQF